MCHSVPHIAAAEGKEPGNERDNRDGGDNEEGAGHV
jgi:hypothetical protein